MWSVFYWQDDVYINLPKLHSGYLENRVSKSINDENIVYSKMYDIGP